MFYDSTFLKKLFYIALPVTVQNLIISALNMDRYFDDWYGRRNRNSRCGNCKPVFHFVPYYHHGDDEWLWDFYFSILGVSRMLKILEGFLGYKLYLVVLLRSF